MNKSRDYDPGTQRISRPGWLDRAVEDFKTAWKRALEGGPQPQIADYLEGRSHAERVVLRRELETVDREFRRQLTARDNGLTGSMAASTDSAAKQDTDASIPSHTMARSPHDSPDSRRDDATLNLTPINWSTPTQDATLNLDNEATGPPAMDETVLLAPGALQPPRQGTTALAESPLMRLEPTINLDPNAQTPPHQDTMRLGEVRSTNLQATVNLNSSAGAAVVQDVTTPLGDESRAEAGAENDKPDGKFPDVAGYKILGILGRGGMGVVYRARHVKLDRVVALKMVIAGAHAGPDELARFYTEAQAVAHLQHPNIIQIYEVGEQEGLPYFSLEFVCGGSLTQKCAGKPQPDNEAAQLVESLARAMHHAHEHGVVHRDLKPANILLTSDGAPKITDFGLAKRLEGESSSKTRSGAILGTPSYMAPEQASGEVHHIGPLTDVYSLGAILYELITGRPPFLASKAMDTVMQVIREEPVPLKQLQPTVARDLETICMKCLQKEPAKRYPSADALAEDLRRFQSGEPITARPVLGPERLWRWCRRNPRTAGLSTTIAGLILLITVQTWISAVRSGIQRDKAIAARERAEAAEWMARQSEEAATRNAELAAAHATLASEQTELALDAFKTVVTESDAELRDKPAMGSLRTKLFDMALKRLDKVARNDQNAAVLDRARAQAYMQKVFIFMQLGKRAEAAEAQRAAHEILERLVANSPEGVDADKGRGNLAVSVDTLADLVASRDPETGRKYNLEALRLREDLRANPKSTFYAEHTLEHFVANSFDRLGAAELRLDNPSGAGDYFLRSLEIRRRNLPWAIEPSDEYTEYLQSLAGTLALLGQLNQRTRTWQASREYFDDCLRLRWTLAEQDPLNVTYRQNLASTHRLLGDSLMFTNDAEAAAENYRESLAIVKQLVEVDGRIAFRRSLADQYYRLGSATLRTAGPAAADEYFQQALRIIEPMVAANPGNNSLKTFWTVTLARCGQHEKAAAAAAEISFAEPQDRNLFQAACGYSLAIAAVAHLKSGDELTPADRDLQQRYADAALDALRRAVEKGYKDVTSIETDPDLDPLRKFAGFAEFLKELNAPTR